MNVRSSFVLPADLLLLPVAELPEETRNRFTHEGTDIAVSRPGSRMPSRIIDASTAKLLERFREPTTIVQAVVGHASERGGDPEETLVEAFPVLRTLINDGLLVTPDHAGEKSPSTLAPGDTFAGYTIVRLLQAAKDADVYLARNAHAAEVALKIARDGVPPDAIEREAAFLEHLRGTVAPALDASGVTDGRAFLATSWVAGIDIDSAARELRSTDDPSGLMDLAVRVAKAYERLHTMGVAHGDVQPRNVLVDRSGRVYLIDFGLGGDLDGRLGLGPGPRGGVPFFMDPEYAAAVANERRPPPLTREGEQYSVATLVYMLLTGRHYLAFSLEEGELYRQIQEDPPAEICGAVPVPVGGSLLRALAKDPAGRHPTMGALAAELESAGRPRVPHGPTSSPKTTRRCNDVLERTLEHLDLDGPWLGEVSPPAPQASVAHGAAGVALGLLHMATVRQDLRLLALADVWAERAGSFQGEAAFSDPEKDLVPERVGTISPYHTRSGVECVRALIASARGDVGGWERGVADFAARSQGPCTSLDLTLGRAGTLLASALLLNAAPTGAQDGRSMLRTLGESTVAQIWAELDGFASIAACDELPNMGIAHGWAGIIYSTLLWNEVAGGDLPAPVERRLDELAAASQPLGRGRTWPWRDRLGQNAFMPGWCNGAAGFVFLWIAAARGLRREGFSRMAEDAAFEAWEAPEPGGSLCCGLAGRAWSLLAMHRMTGETSWLRRAIELADRAAAMELSEDVPALSLHKGVLGVACLAADLQRPRLARIPMFEIAPGRAES